MIYKHNLKEKVIEQLDRESNFMNKEFQKGFKQGQKELFDKFDKYACIKNDKWYLDFKKERLNDGR